MPFQEEASAFGFCPPTCSGALEILREELSGTVVREAQPPSLPLLSCEGRVSQSAVSNIWLNSQCLSFQSDDLCPSALSASAVDCPSAQ